MMHGGNYGWGMGYGGFFMILFWVLVILGVVYIVQAAVRSRTGPEQKESPLDVLKKRYARGEITKEEYEKMKDDLIKS